MLKDVVAVKYLGGRRLRLLFEDGAEGEVDLAGSLKFTGVFAPLADKRFFARVKVHPELGTIFWPNGADLDPDVLYAAATGKPLPDFTDKPISVAEPRGAYSPKKRAKPAAGPRKKSGRRR